MDIQRELKNNGYRAYRTLSLVNNSTTHLAIVDTRYKKNELEELKKQCKKNGLPIIYITSEINNNVINELKKDAIGIFKKPFNIDQIIELINEHFKNETIY